MYKTAELFAARLTEVEKIGIRGATTPDELEQVFQIRHRAEFDLPIDLARIEFLKAVGQIREAFVAQSTETGFGLTWKF